MPKTVTRVDVDALLATIAEQPRADDVDTRILDATVTLLHRQGLTGLEVDDVAEAAGVGRSTVYRRFRDRNDLITAALATEGRRFLAALAAAVAPIDDPVEQVVAAFSAGLRVARRGDLGALLRQEPVLLRLMTVDNGPVLAAARAQLVAEMRRHSPHLDADTVAGSAEMLIRLAISFVVSPDTVLPLDDASIEDTVRRHVAPLVRTD